VRKLLLIGLSVPDSQEPTTQQVLLLSRDDLKYQGGRGQNEQSQRTEKRGRGVWEKREGGMGWKYP